MTPSKCPDCGARLPAKAGHYTCVYCKREIDIVDEKAKPAPQKQVIVVVPPETTSHTGEPRGGGGFGWIWSLVVLGIVGAGVWPALKMLPKSGVLSPFASWDGKTTLECSGNDELTFEDKQVTLTGTAVIASGNCHLKLLRCAITGDTAIEAGGNARVTVEGGAIVGHKLSIDAGGNAHVEVRSATLTGKTKRSGNARINH
jgi:hypothetical protein